jgi:SAM-dependent methyltransferase
MLNCRAIAFVAMMAGVDLDRSDIEGQAHKWSTTFAHRPNFLGAEPSQPGREALERFQSAGAASILELGAGQGRDTLLFARAGLDVVALDYVTEGLDQLVEAAAPEAPTGRITSCVADVRATLPFGDATFDACYAHMLLSMALTTPEIERLTGEVHRVLRPGGLFVYTVRNTADAHFGQGVAHGDDRFEMGGFIVHFFDRALVDRLAAIGFELVDVREEEEGRLPRRLFVVTMRAVA